MSLKCGIIGLTNTGKTTMFNCISNTKAAITDFAYSTNKSNIGVCNVPDERLAKINTPFLYIQNYTLCMYKSQEK